MSLQYAIDSNNLTGIFSSGVSPITYEEQWKIPHPDVPNTLVVPSESSGSVDITTRFETYFSLHSHVMSSFYTDITAGWDPLPIIRQDKLSVTELDKIINITESLEMWTILFWGRLTTSNTEQRNLYKTINRFRQRQKISERFEVLAHREDNWDGYDSKKPTELILKRAQNLLEEMLDIISSEHPWFTPFISSDEDGYITAAWHKGERELHIEIEEKEAEYTKISGSNQSMKMEIDFLKPDNFLTLWEWLLDVHK